MSIAILHQCGCNIPGLKHLKCEALHPGVETPVPVTARLGQDGLHLTVPLVRGCAMVKLRN